MNTAIILLNVYYSGVAIALLVHDILWLRLIMIFAQGSLITYGLFIENTVIIAWNSAFVSINVVQSIRLFIERRPVAVDPEIRDIYKNIFNDMSEKEFNYFWKHGSYMNFTDRIICSTGSIQNNLLLLLTGVAMVKKEGREIANLVRGNFIGEMGFITDSPASADVFAEGEVTCICWERSVFYSIMKAHPDIINKLQKIISLDLINKLQVRND